jgi:hypothetical protein
MFSSINATIRLDGWNKCCTFATRIDDSTIQKEDYPMAEEKLVVQD